MKKHYFQMDEYWRRCRYSETTRVRSRDYFLQVKLTLDNRYCTFSSTISIIILATTLLCLGMTCSRKINQQTTFISKDGRNKLNSYLQHKYLEVKEKPTISQGSNILVNWRVIHQNSAGHSRTVYIFSLYRYYVNLH